MVGGLLDPAAYAPVSGGFAPAWEVWYERSADASAEPVGPPAGVIAQLGLVKKLGETIDGNEQLAVMRQILEIAIEQFYGIGVILPGAGYGIAKNTFRNVFDGMPDAFLYPTPGPTNPEQYYFQDQQ